MLLEDDINVSQSVFRTVNARKYLKRNLKCFINWFISQTNCYPSEIEFERIRNGKGFIIETTSSLIDEITDKYWKHTTLMKFGPVVTSKIATQRILEDLYTNVINHLEENNLSVYDYKIKYKTYSRWI